MTFLRRWYKAVFGTPYLRPIQDITAVSFSLLPHYHNHIGACSETSTLQSCQLSFSLRLLKTTGHFLATWYVYPYFYMNILPTVIGVNTTTINLQVVRLNFSLYSENAPRGKRRKKNYTHQFKMTHDKLAETSTLKWKGQWFKNGVGLLCLCLCVCVCMGVYAHAFLCVSPQPAHYKSAESRPTWSLVVTAALMWLTWCPKRLMHVCFISCQIRSTISSSACVNHILRVRALYTYAIVCSVPYVLLSTL